MAKRFTDTEKWEQDWFIVLPGGYKLFWLYILDKCDCAGVWRPNIIIANERYKFDVDLQKALELLNADKSRILVLPNGRWFIRGFIPFQYGRHLSTRCSAHRGVIKSLESNDVPMDMVNPPLRVSKGLGMGSPTLKDKDKDKDKDKSLSLLKPSATEEPKIPKAETDIQKIVKVWKLLNSIPVEGPESQSWDKVHFPRHAKSASSLLTLFGDWEKAAEAMEFVYMSMVSKKLTCTIETMVKHSDLYREYLSGRRLS